MGPSTGVVLACLQLAFALCWVIYVIYLPNLAVQAGLPRSAVAWILLMDQVIFVACDWAAGVYADKVGRTFGRVGPQIAVATMLSALAFVSLPWVAPTGSVVLFIGLTAFWSVTSSALRAPPLTLFARHATTSGRAWLSGLYMLGLGIAAALAPYLGTQLRNFDPRIPFLIATVMVVLVTLVVALAERRASALPAVHEPASDGAQPSRGSMAGFALAIVLFAIGFQLHFSVLSAPSYLRFATTADLERLIPVFWIGFNLAVLPATLIAKRLGGAAVMAPAAILGAFAVVATLRAPSLDVLVALQFAIGAAWGFILTGAFSAALDAGRPGREGSATGLLFSMLALAALARILFVINESTRVLAATQYIHGLPALLWGIACTVLLVALPRRER